jgi:Holliday junction resolvase
VNTKGKGSRRERQARTILETAGYFVVKAGGSLGCWDLVALGPQGARLVQVKSNEKPRPAERERLAMFPRFPYTSKEVWIFFDRQREPVIEVL